MPSRCRRDIRDTAKLSQALKGVDAVINLACISNDASFELDEKLSTTINLDAFEKKATEVADILRALANERRAMLNAGGAFGIISAAATEQFVEPGWLEPEPRCQPVAGSEHESCWRLRLRSLRLQYANAKRTGW